jgi:hypothetical protein
VALSFIDHLLAIPKAAASNLPDEPRLEVPPREVDFS